MKTVRTEHEEVSCLPCALVSLSCPLDVAWSHLRGDLNEDLSRSGGPMDLWGIVLTV